MRIAVPDLDDIIRKYLNYDPSAHQDLHNDFANVYEGSFFTKGEFMDICMRAWGHTYLYNYEDLEILLKKANFKNVQRFELNQSNVPLLQNRESRPADQSSLIVESEKT